jgi:hypothetical protein
MRPRGASRARSVVPIVALSLLLAGCPGPQPTEPPPAPSPTTPPDAANPTLADTPEEPSGFANRVGQYTPLDAPVPIETDGLLQHVATAQAFPKEVAGFGRIGSKRYDAEGHDLGIGYARSWRSALASVTIYVYPRVLANGAASEDSVEMHLDAVIQQVRGRQKDVKEVRRTSGTATLRGNEVAYAAVELEHRGGPQHFGRRQVSCSTVTSADAWWIKVRVTTPVENGETALDAVDELLAELGLPGTGLPAGAD